MSKFPVDAPIKRVIEAFELLNLADRANLETRYPEDRLLLRNRYSKSLMGG